jgi:hypothetical protein
LGLSRIHGAGTDKQPLPGNELLILPRLLQRPGKNDVKDFAPVEWVRSGARILFVFLGRNEVVLGGIKIGRYLGELLEEVYFDKFP